MFIEELAFGIVALKEARQDKNKRVYPYSIWKRMEVELLYWGCRMLLNICVVYHKVFRNRRRKKWGEDKI